MFRCQFVYNKTAKYNIQGTRCRNRTDKRYCRSHAYACIHGKFNYNACLACNQSEDICTFVYKSGRKCKKPCASNLSKCYIHKYTCAHNKRKTHCKICKKTVVRKPQRCVREKIHDSFLPGFTGLATMTELAESMK